MNSKKRGVEGKQLLKSFLLVGLLISVFVVSVEIVSADSIIDKLGGPTTSVSTLSDYLDGDRFAQFLFCLLITLVIFAVSENLPFLPERKSGLKFLIAMIIGILSSFYLDTTQIRSILMSYNTLGVTITLIIPFVAVAAIYKKMAERHMHLWAKLLWIIFGGVILIRYLSADLNEIGSFGTFAYPIILGCIILMIVLEKVISSALAKEAISTSKRALARKIKKSAHYQKLQAAAADEVILADDEESHDA